MTDRNPTPFMPAGLATGMGSLPHLDAREALDVILAHIPEIPHWPQLPRRSAREHFVFQFLQPLVDCGVLVRRNRRWGFDTCREDHADCLTRFYTTALAAQEGDAESLHRFSPTPEAAAGFHAFLARAQSAGLTGVCYVKGQIAGPLTIALELKDQDGIPAYYNETLRDVVVRTLALNARSQAAALSGIGIGNGTIVFVDDPGLSACGSRLHLSISRKTVVDDLNLIFDAIRSEGALTGVHSCEAIDWSLLTESAVDIISVDVYRYADSLIPYAAELRKFLARGGVAAWGIVPTLDDPFAETPASLHNRLVGIWEAIFPDGFDRETLIRQSLITPACGTGLLSEAQAVWVYELTAAVSRRIRSA
ncbi:MAG TPA: hypothetical protein ACFCUC_09725 [Desulfobacterales bacterium]